MRRKRRESAHTKSLNYPVERLESRLHLNAADLDASFGIGGKAVATYLQSNDETATRMITMSDGRIVVGVDTGVSDGTTTTHGAALMRFTADGQPDPTFGANGQVQLPELTWSSGVKDMT